MNGIMRRVITTNCLAVREGRMLLGRKKRRFGEGKWNGFGGKVEAGESVLESAAREITEECGIVSTRLEPAGVLEAVYEGTDEVYEIHIIRIADFTGEPRESDEMLPQWFPVAQLPFREMWPDDYYWMPWFLEGQTFRGSFTFEGYEKITSFDLRLIERKVL